MSMLSKIDRFTGHMYMQGDFKKVNISPSQTALNNQIWFIKYPLANYLRFKPEQPSIAFKTGTFVHKSYQDILIGKMKIADVELAYKKILESHKFSEKEQAKGNFLLERIKKYVENHLQMLMEISGSYMKDWQVEKAFYDWYDDEYIGQKLEIVNEGSIDSYNSKLKIFTEHKNRFGSVYLGKKGTYLYRKPTKIKTPQFTHLIAIAVYFQHFEKKYQPALIYVDEDGAMLFNAQNCEDLTPQGLEYYFHKFIQINIQRQQMLRMAEGDIRKLACMIGIDWSDLRHKDSNIFLSHMQEEDVKKIEEFYNEL